MSKVEGISRRNDFIDLTTQVRKNWVRLRDFHRSQDCPIAPSDWILKKVCFVQDEKNSLLTIGIYSARSLCPIDTARSFGAFPIPSKSRHDFSSATGSSNFFQSFARPCFPQSKDLYVSCAPLVRFNRRNHIITSTVEMILSFSTNIFRSCNIVRSRISNLLIQGRS